MDSLGKTLVLVGLLTAVVGMVVWFFGRSGGAFLPGDIVVQRKHGTFYFPIVTCLVVSGVLSAMFWLMRR